MRATAYTAQDWHSNLARQLPVHPAPEVAAPRFEVHEGRGGNGAARRSLDEGWARAFRLFLVGVAVLGAPCAARVQLSVVCLQELTANAQLTTDVHEAEDLARSLVVEKSSLTSAECIERIAVQNLGLEYQGSGTPIQAPTEG